MTTKKENKEKIMEEDNSINDEINDSDETGKKKDSNEIEEEVDPLEKLTKKELIDKIKNLEEEITIKAKDIENLKDWKSKYMHLQAEFENAQKRWNRDKSMLRLEYMASVLKNFLPLYDSYKKAIEGEPDNKSIEQFYNQFLNIFKAHDGAKIMDVKINDSFDYHYHEALASVERDDVPSNTIIDIIQDGWLLGKEVLRYAKVITSKQPKPPEPEEKKEITNDSESTEDAEYKEKID